MSTLFAIAKTEPEPVDVSTFYQSVLANPAPEDPAITASCILAPQVVIKQEPKNVSIPIVATQIVTSSPLVLNPVVDDVQYSTPANQPAPSVSIPIASSGALPTPPLTPKTKNAKIKSQITTVTMATAATATPANSSPGSTGENTGRWTAEEHRLFLQGLEQHGKGWKKIASLIKSRTVVQIRTHAQKYFQKLAKARQNGDGGDVSIEGQCDIIQGSSSSAIGVPDTSLCAAEAAAANAAKRRRQYLGTKRKAIASVVASAQREGKRLSSCTPSDSPPPPTVASALAPFVSDVPMPPHSGLAQSVPIPSITTTHETNLSTALEDSLFRFLTPSGGDFVYFNPVAATSTVSTPATPFSVNDIARQAGANPITLPFDNNNNQVAYGGDLSPTGVNEFYPYYSWSDSKTEPPAWYTKGADVDELLNQADALDWLSDPGDLDESYRPTANDNTSTVPQSEPSLLSVCETDDTNGMMSENTEQVKHVTPSSSVNVIFSKAVNMPELPSLFESSNSIISDECKKPDYLSSSLPFGSATDAADATKNFTVLDTHFDEQAFVFALLENNGDFSVPFSALQ